MDLETARNALRENVEKGATCPCCGQFAKVYKRSINRQMAGVLLAMFRFAPVGDWIHLPTLTGRKGADEAKLVHWGLIEEASEERRPDGGRAGWWRLTNLGASYVRGTVTVPKYVRLYDGRCLGFTGPQIGISASLGAAFDLSELMSA